MSIMGSICGRRRRREDLVRPPQDRVGSRRELPVASMWWTTGSRVRPPPLTSTFPCPAWRMKSWTSSSLCDPRSQQPGQRRAFYEALGWGGAPHLTTRSVSSRPEEWCLALAALGGHGAPGIELAYTSARPKKSVKCLPRPSRRAVRSSVRQRWWSGGARPVFADPEGYVWEVAHNPGWTLSQDGTVHI